MSRWVASIGLRSKAVSSATGTRIPLMNRIIAVADAYDAMIQDRVYRMRVESSDAVAEILRCTPSQFEPEIVHAFIAVLSRH
jgi:HD-GYP domain-containing protein (c-di-GMP phosphodiesterase class II)